MADNQYEFEDYFSHLQKISFIGRIYKRFYTSIILFLCARRFGKRIAEIGSGTGNGILGAFPKSVQGLDINPVAVQHCKSLGLNVNLIYVNGLFPFSDAEFDVCVLDNVLEHINEPKITLDECYRITKEKGGLIIAVPGLLGFQSDMDHKVFYTEEKLCNLDHRWKLLSIFSTPFIFTSEKLSTKVKQYCLVAIYEKV
ncbi:MAG: class I SAM-dependent methyltransferase [Methylophilus sp.]